MNRYHFFEKIIKTIKPYKDSIDVYGSFSNNTFHYQESEHISYSDIDLYCKNEISSKFIDETINNIKKRIIESTGVNMRISLREKRIHDKRLDYESSFYIALFECIYKIENNCDSQHIMYQAAKFILRTAGYSAYYEKKYSFKEFISLGIPESIAKKLTNTKFGSYNLSYYDYINILKNLKMLCPEMYLYGLNICNTEARKSIINYLWPYFTEKMYHRHDIIKDLTQKLISVNYTF